MPSFASIADLEKNWLASDYNENDSLTYYINENHCDKGDIAYMYDAEDQRLDKLKIHKIISRADDLFIYDQLLENDDILLDGEEFYEAETSAEFITDDTCYLVWFDHVESKYDTKDTRYKYR